MLIMTVKLPERKKCLAAGALALLLVVLGLAAACAVAYFHARGGFIR